ncbi:MAG TPA: hypothetical protein H9857_12450 [Candidatus Desulfovibrio intestinigallinarum]|nr:hypothetical protein [Candidatus Desulfovibrio intestinigallinarum]
MEQYHTPWAQAALPHGLYRLSLLRRFAIENDKTRGSGTAPRQHVSG